jgi:HD-like signal output (HDOD) protein
MATANTLNLQVLRIKNLPDLPVASVKILNAVNDSNIVIDELVALISVSPILVARLLGLANSAYFGCRGQVKDIKVAIVRVLGLDLVRSLIISLILNMELDTRKCNRFDNERFWMDAFLTATLGQSYSHVIRDQDLVPAEVYSTGLILNIGLILAVYLLPEQTNQVFINAENNASSIATEMSELIGEDQFSLGGLLLQHWHLPVMYCTAVKEFNNTDYQGDARKMLDLLKLCAVMAQKIRSEQYDDLSPLIHDVQSFGLSAQQAQSVIDTILAKKEAIYTTALTIGGRVA